MARDLAQQLMNDLWNSGVRPTGIHHRDQMVAAQSFHLRDMRAIVAKKLSVDLGGEPK
jgi:hypothetical protein